MSMKVFLTIFAVLGLSACGNIQPSKSPCFTGGTATCKFTPLADLHAKGK